MSAGTNTVTSTGSAPTKSSVTAEDKVEWRRNGDMIEVRGSYRQTANTSGVDGSGTYLWLLPQTVDTTHVTCAANASIVTTTSSNTNISCGTGAYGEDNSTRGTASAYCYDSTHVSLYDFLGGNPIAAGSVFGFSTNAAQGVSWRACYPVANWQP